MTAPTTQHEETTGISADRIQQLAIKAAVGSPRLERCHAFFSLLAAELAATAPSATATLISLYVDPLDMAEDARMRDQIFANAMSPEGQKRCASIREWASTKLFTEDSSAAPSGQALLNAAAEQYKGAPVIIYGAPGSGKSQYAQRLANYYGKRTILDEACANTLASLTPEDIAFTNEPPTEHDYISLNAALQAAGIIQPAI